MKNSLYPIEMARPDYIAAGILMMVLTVVLPIIIGLVVLVIGAVLLIQGLLASPTPSDNYL